MESSPPPLPPTLAGRGLPSRRGSRGRFPTWLAGLTLGLSTGFGAALTPAQTEFFENRIRPILANECYECHGATKQKGGLRLDSREALRRGGDSGVVLVPGDPAASLLLRSVRHTEPDLEMPKDRPQLASSVLVDLAQWIQDGAPDPRDHPPTESTAATGWESVFQARREWWSFQPLQSVAVPPGEAAHPVDRFLDVRLRELGLTPAAAAPRNDLIRRVTFALTGLPPTAEEIDAFLGDTSPDAFAKVVDRLLESPRFGEHWARRWMDLVRFAETHGSEGDPDIPNAWRYRDYLIRAFNADVPADQLIREHIAGDLLERPRINERDGINESLVGLTHLRLVEHGFQAVDTLDEQVKTVDSQIDVLSKAFQGLTTSCARCHDHKFDPISQRDYYALYGILASSRPTHLSVDLPDRLRVYRAELASLQTQIRGSLGEAWAQATADVSRRLNAVTWKDGRPQWEIPGDELVRRIATLEQQIQKIDDSGRATLTTSQRSANTSSLPEPARVWTFEGSAEAQNGELVGGARIEGGQLHLDGRDSVFRAPSLDRPLAEKTLEVWVQTADLNQRGGGVLTVETDDGTFFDSVVLGERQPRKWMSGSDGLRRSADAQAAEESSTNWVHLAIVYRADQSIALFRNGEPYGTPYTPSGDQATLRVFQPGRSRFLLGQRHTGGGRAFFAGRIEEARVYDRALSSADLANSFQVGPNRPSPEAILAALSDAQRVERTQVQTELEEARRTLATTYPEFAPQDAARKRWLAALESAAAQSGSPFQAWRDALSRTNFSQEWSDFVAKQNTQALARAEVRQKSYQPFWRVGDSPDWFRYGANPPETIPAGSFTLLPTGERVLDGILPASVVSHRWSQKHNGVFASPSFKVTTDRISIRGWGGHGARIRLICDQYPIGQGNIFPQANLGANPGWITLDTAYRKGSTAYLEFATAEDVTSRDRSGPGPGGRSFFGVSEVVFHDVREAPPEALTAATEFLAGEPVTSPAELTSRLTQRLQDSVVAWRAGTLTEAQQRFFDSWVRSGLLPVELPRLPEVAPLIAEYRRLEAEIPTARRVPGVVEAAGTDSPLLVRGDHQRPGEAVPRGYLQVASRPPYRTPQSGRRELADDLTSPANPLTARVMANRLWHYLYGQGLVATVDNLGRLGDQPTHPELLDYLALRLQQEGWSFKRMIRFLVLTDAWQRSSQPSAEAREKDPSNQAWSHARVRRLEAESVRDSLLAISGRLDLTQYGPGANALAPAPEQRRRSVYLTVRRNFLSPFLEVFDAPKPFSTLGRRDTTNVPGQSLALLNDPFVIEQARQWSARVCALESSDDGRIQRLYLEAFARQPEPEELVVIHNYLADLRQQSSGDEAGVWRDFAQSLFNLKEFIYLR
ncbi:MAG: DUF1553 domain-containing protein [Verrucomicrobia bacterium]|nr:DUF1553 domain-containing protein [Verrucomicrobiota bacterium]